jgi:hypothetical protein
MPLSLADILEITVADAVPGPEPHPELAAAIVPTAAEMLRAAEGLFPSRPWFTPAVPARRETT